MQNEYIFRLKNGLEIKVRQETAADLSQVIELFEHVSPESRLEHSSEWSQGLGSAAIMREATQLMQLDPTRAVVWLAFADLPDHPSLLVASAHYTRTAPDQAELSVVVRDDMQRQGIGSRMLYFALDQARAAGIRKVMASFDSKNEAAWQILQYSPYHITWQPNGQKIEVAIHLQARTTTSTVLN